MQRDVEALAKLNTDNLESPSLWHVGSGVLANTTVLWSVRFVWGVSGRAAIVLGIGTEVKGIGNNLVKSFLVSSRSDVLFLVLALMR